ncbi:MAG TPA: helix-turn-helix domain-containing protein [Actinomycetes bacterium]|nr:helix-turn-helix domain-containing protein [Actinomycetes bacterium]
MTTKAPESPPILVSVEEAARLLGLSRGKAYELASRGELPVVRFGRSVRVHRDRLEAWVNEQAR